MKVLRTDDWQFIKSRLEVDAMTSRTDAAKFGALSLNTLDQVVSLGYELQEKEFLRLAERSEKLAVDLAEMYDLD